MKNNRRDFLKMAGIGTAGVLGGPLLQGFGAGREGILNPATSSEAGDLTLIGEYGHWAASLNDGKIPSHSFRRKEFSDIGNWRPAAKARLLDRLAMPDLGGTPEVTVKKKYTWDGLHIEELSWKLPYGRPAEGIFLKPEGATKPLPGILGLHDHAGLKYFGKRKITRTSAKLHPMIEAHQKKHYGGMAWANEVAKRGYAVLVPDAFPFASRRVMLKDVPEDRRRGLTDDDPEKVENIQAYNRWAGGQESIMAKSLFCAGTTWPGVFLAEDQQALDVLCAREDVDEEKIGCGGLSGGGMRTVFIGGLDPRIKCAVCVGFMTTWKDLLLYRSSSHTWMTFVPVLPNELDFPEILALRVPLPTLVLNTNEDHLYTLEGMKAADEIFTEIYRKANASDRYRGSFHPGGHKFDGPMQKEAFDWYDKWLKA